VETVVFVGDRRLEKFGKLISTQARWRPLWWLLRYFAAAISNGGCVLMRVRRRQYFGHFCLAEVPIFLC
jgi:hypothetical protein